MTMKMNAGRITPGAISRRRITSGKGAGNQGTFSGIRAELKPERVSEFGKPQGGSPLRQNPSLNHSANRMPRFQSPLGQAIARRRMNVYRRRKLDLR